MPAAAVAAVTAAAVAAQGTVAYAIAYAITYAVVSTAITVAISTVAGALGKKPKSPTASNFTQDLRDRTLTARQPISPRRIIYGNVRVGGVFTFLHLTGNNNEYFQTVVTISGHSIEAVDGLYFDGVEVPLDENGDATGDFAGFVHVEYNLGTADQAAFAGLVEDAPDKWTVNHRQRGCAGAYIRLKYDEDKFPNGLPAITFQVRGKNDIYDPRTSTYGYTANAALCAADYIALENIGLGAAYGTEILEADLIEAANICDEDVAVLSGGTEKRYECNGTLETDLTPFENLKSLTGSMAGAAITQGKFWLIRAGAYRAPEISALTDGDFIGSIEMKTLQSRAQSFNGVKGVFTSPVNDWQPDDFPAVQVPAYVTADNGESVWSEVVLPMTTSASAAQRIARLMLESARRQISVTVPCRTRAYQLQPFDTVQLTIDRYGWTDKTFQVTNMELILDKAWSVRLDLKETDANVYAWSTTDESVYAAAPRTTLPNTFDISPPGLVLSDEIVLGSTGNIVTNLLATLTPPNDAYVNRFQTQFKLSTDSEWSDMGNSDALIHIAANVTDGATYDVRARSINAAGIKSAWSATKSRTIIGQSALPPDVTAFNVSIVDGAANLSWEAVNVVDLSHYRIKYSTALTGATWASSTLLVDKVGKPATSITVPALVGTYLIKAVDYGGRESQNALTVSSNVAALRTFNAIETVTEDPDFIGIKDQVITFDGKLELDYAGDVFARTDYFEVVDFFLGVDGFYSEGYYYFNNEVDLVDVFTSRVTADLTVNGVNYNSDVFGRPDYFAVADFFDVDTSQWDTVLEIRTTEDDPAGSPVTWLVWQPFVTGDYQARAFQFRVKLTSSQFGVTSSVTGVSVNIDMPDETRAADDLTVTVAGLNVTFSPAFRALKGVGISAQGLQTGDYYTITSKTAAGFTIQFFDSTNTAIERTFDYVAVGYGRVS